MPKAFPLITIVLFFISANVCSQNLTGTWEGYIDNSGEYWRMSIIHTGDSCFCSSYDGTGTSFCYQNFKAAFDRKENKFKGQGINFISKTFDHVLITAALSYSKEGRDEYLTGNVKAKSILAQVFSFGTSTSSRLRKISSNVDSTDYIRYSVKRLNAIPRPDSTKITNTKKELPETIAVSKENDSTAVKKMADDSVVTEKNNRITAIAKTITTAADTVVILVSDDGDIDGDIVTIFDNDRIIVQRLLLTKEPYRITLALPQNGSKHTIELMAENEGSIPPNTAYMLVQAGTERVEVKASSGKKSNAAVVVLKSN